jgi:hypothetical protein
MLKILASALLAAVLAAPSIAATVTCTGTGRSFTLDTSPVSACAAVAAKGANNISGNASGAKPDPLFALLGPNLAFLDKFGAESEGEGAKALKITANDKGLAGSFSFAIAKLIAAAGKQYYDFVIAFKSGGNSGSQSVWAAFSLADGVTSGSWSFTGRNGLSHVNLYAHVRDTPPSTPVPTVPVPAAGGMLLAGLAGLFGIKRLRRRA